jgi:hypothetical protein
VRLPLLLAPLVACGGAPISASAHLTPTCELAMRDNLQLELPPVDLAARPADPTLRASRVTLTADAVAGPEPVEAVYEAWSAYVRTAPPPSEGPTLIVAEAAVPAAAVALLVKLAFEDGRAVALAADSSTALGWPAWADPAVADATLSRVGAAPPDARLPLIAQEFSQAAAWCPAVTQVFQAVAMAPPESKCTLLAVGLDEALPTCVFTSGPKVVTLAQLLVAPDPVSKRPTSVRLSFDPAAAPLDLGGGAWREAAARIASRDGQAVGPPLAE